eukprot:scaffold175582_cov23-Tisochrysis_lutea.AAC.1
MLQAAVLPPGVCVRKLRLLKHSHGLLSRSRRMQWSRPRGTQQGPWLSSAGAETSWTIQFAPGMSKGKLIGSWRSTYISLTQ